MHTKYEKKDEWWRRGKNILIQVKRSDVTPYAVEDGGQRWCIYAFIYPGHPYFTEFAAEDGNMMQPAAAAMPCHSYASFFRVHSLNTKAEKSSAIKWVGISTICTTSASRTLLHQGKRPKCFPAQKVFTTGYADLKKQHHKRTNHALQIQTKRRAVH